jgi:hypothetical protein
MTLTSETRLTLDLLGGKRPERFEGTPAEIVQLMNATAFIPEADAQAYMARFARYSQMIDGRPIRTTSAEAFIEDLLALGIAVRVKLWSGCFNLSATPQDH